MAWYVHERRNGETMADYARAKGIRYDTVKKLARDQRVLQLLDDELRASNAGALRTQQILDMLHRKAVIDHDVRAARVYMECVGGLIPRRQVDVVVRDARLLSYEQLRAELSRALELLDRDQRAEAQTSSRPRAVHVFSSLPHRTTADAAVAYCQPTSPPRVSRRCSGGSRARCAREHGHLGRQGGSRGSVRGAERRRCDSDTPF